MCGPMPRMHADDGTGKALCGQPSLDFVFKEPLFRAFGADKTERNDNKVLHEAGIYIGPDAHRCKQCEKKM